MTHTYQFCDGLDQQDLLFSDAAAGGAVESTIVSLSRYSRRLNPAAASHYVRWGTNILAAGAFNLIGSEQDAVWYSFHFYIAAAPSAGLFMNLAHQTGSGAERGRVQIRDDLKYRVDRAAGDFGVSTATLSLNHWYVASFFGGQLRNARCIVRDRDTGATVDDVSSTTAAGGAAGISRVLIGSATDVSTGDVYFDNILVEAGALANIDDPVSDVTTKYTVGLLVADGTGSEDAWTGTFADVDDFPNDGDGTFRKATTALNFTQSMKPTTSLVAAVANIVIATAWTIVRDEGAVSSIRLRLVSSGTASETTSGDPGVTYIPIRKIFLVDPATGSAWTTSAIDGVELGMSSQNAVAVRCTQVALAIAYRVGIISRVRQTHYFIESYDPEKRIVDLQGHEVPYNEVRSNRWLRLLRKGFPTSQEEESYFDMEDMFYIEGLTYEQQWGQEPRLQLKGPDDFVADLIDKITKAGAGGL